MNYRTLLMVLGSVFMIGCGGGGGNPGAGNGNPGAGNAINIDLEKDIKDGKVTGYDATDPIEDQYLAVINYLRGTKIQCDDPDARKGPTGIDMQWNTFLADAAKEHSEDMKLSVHYAHDGSGTVNDTTGQTLTPVRASKFHERISRNGYSTSPTAENIAMSNANYVLPNDYWIKIMEGWIKSKKGHCSNIMDPQLIDFGMHESRANIDGNGIYNTYWTQDFGAH